MRPLIYRPLKYMVQVFFDEMSTFQSRFLFVFRGWCMAVIAVDACPYEECVCDATEIDCSERELISIPIIHTYEETVYPTLNLDTNEISEISAGSLPARLEEISLNDNPVTSIDDDAFNDLSTTLHTLSFSNANFTRIPDAFLHLKALEYLCIKDTHILDWNVGAMVHIGQTLRSLILENVGLNTWPVWLQNFSSLNELNIISSNLSSMPHNAFDKLAKNLLTLTLNNNCLTAVPKSLSSLKNLMKLDLNDNIISDIHWLPNSSRLSHLDLNSNNISDAEGVSNALRRYKNSLTYLTLCFNRLSTIPDLSDLTMLQSLDLSYNEIADVYSDSVPVSVDDLNFSHNLLLLIPVLYRNLTFIKRMYLPHNTIQEMQGSDIPPWVTELDLTNNLLLELTHSSFLNNSGLQVLILDNNPIDKITKLAFKNLGSLISLSLQNTNLTRLPLSLAYLTNIRDVDMSNSANLVCTCQERSLEPTIMSDIQFSGNCGLISIYNFFATLDLTCP